jgi:peptide-methionine (S)-S-oxide reductase
MGNPPSKLLDESECPPGRESAIPNAPAPDATHYVKEGSRLNPPFPDGTEMISLGMGCFWCSENVFMNLKGVYSTQAGYQGGATKNPTYEEICTGTTNHAGR